jgi:apolipoprotein N-acyltransferase
MLKTPSPTSKQSRSRERNALNTSAPASTNQLAPRTNFQALLLGLTGSLLLWAAFPPLNLPLLAWLAPLPWLYLIQQPVLSGRRPYIFLWLAGTIHWLLMLDGIRLAHPALYAGWLALSAYLGVYLPVFIGLTRVAVHRLNLSLVTAAPIVWIGLELLRGHLITGFSMGLLAHTHAEFPYLIQISDLAGGYTLSFLIMLVAACIASMFPFSLLISDLRPLTSIRIWPLLPATAALLATLLYGHWRLNQSPPGQSGPNAKVALIQGSLDTVFVAPTAERVQTIFDHHRQLTAKAVKQHRNLDLVVWPESAYATSETIVAEPLTPPPGISAETARASLIRMQNSFQKILADDVSLTNSNTDPSHVGTKFVMGTTSVEYGPHQPRFYNSALLANRAGNVVGRYYKTHPVMFGEYIPFAEYISWLNKITPIETGLSSGDGPKTFDVAGLKFAPSICFESTVPHLIRNHLATLARKKEPADVLINVTNDGWFWGTSMLDLHFRCGVFRAVENRKPMLVAANTGISTFVDGNGVIRQRGPRRRSQVLIAEVQADGRQPPYALLGDWLAWICAACCLGLAWMGCRPYPQAAQSE